MACLTAGPYLFRECHRTWKEISKLTKQLHNWSYYYEKKNTELYQISAIQGITLGTVRYINGGRYFLYKVQIYFYWLKATFKEMECQKKEMKKRDPNHPFALEMKDTSHSKSQILSKVIPKSRTWSPTLLSYFPRAALFSLLPQSLFFRGVFITKFLIECILWEQSCSK